MRPTYRLSMAACLGIATLRAQIVRTPVEPVPPSDGAAMYRSYCAACHGADGKGAGPAAKALKIPVTDLTRLAQSHGGTYPARHLMTLLTKAEGAHGSTEMPVWGDVFREAGQDPATVQWRASSLTRYLSGIQDPPVVPPPAKAASGESTFRTYCATCHGLDGRGKGPVAWTLRAPPADLSMLSSRFGSKFPAELVEKVVLRPGAGTVHGSSDLPLWGLAFNHPAEPAAARQARIRRLVSFLEGLQRQ